jgi:hypothetical protein
MLAAKYAMTLADYRHHLTQKIVDKYVFLLYISAITIL